MISKVVELADTLPCRGSEHFGRDARVGSSPTLTAIVSCETLKDENMVSLGFEKKIAKIVLDIIDKTIGKKFPMIDKLTDLFQEQQIMEKKVRDLELKIEALEHFLKDKN